MPATENRHKNGSAVQGCKEGKIIPRRGPSRGGAGWAAPARLPPPLIPSLGGDHRVKRVGVLSRPQRWQVHLGTRDPCRSHATASWSYLLRSLIKLLSSSSSSPNPPPRKRAAAPAPGGPWCARSPRGAWRGRRSSPLRLTSAMWLPPNSWMNATSERRGRSHA